MCESRKEPFPVVITRSQYTAIHRYRTIRASREGKQPTGDQSDDQQQADNEFRLVLANLFKDGLPEWFPLKELGIGDESQSNDDAGPSEVRVRVVSEQQPTVSTTTTTTTTTPDAAPAAPHTAMDDIDQIFNDELIVFDPETARAFAEALDDGFPAPIIDDARFDVSVAYYPNALSSSTPSESPPAPAGSSQELPPPYQPSGLEFVDKMGESTSSASGSSTLLAPAPLARVEEQHSLYPPSSHLDLDLDLDLNLDLEGSHNWGAILSEFLRTQS